MKPEPAAPLETARLVLEPLAAAHAAAHFPLLQDPALYRFIATGPPASVAELAERYDAMSWGGFPEETTVQLNWCARLREGGAHVGTLQIDGVPGETAVLAYMVFTPHQGRGLAREGLLRMIEHFRETVGAREFAAMIDARNSRSIRLVESLGFERDAGAAGSDVRYVLRGPPRSSLEPCAGCGLVLPGGTSACQALFDALLARDFSDPTYFRVHRLLVDTYSLQHPERYCASAKSLAAHLTGLCWLLEMSEKRAVGSKALQRWLNGPAPVEKPPLPSTRGALTIAHVGDATEAGAYARALEEWARSTWAAYEPLHTLAREWIALAQA